METFDRFEDPVARNNMRRMAAERLLSAKKYQLEQLEDQGVYTPEDFALHKALQEEIGARSVGLIFPAGGY